MEASKRLASEVKPVFTKHRLLKALKYLVLLSLLILGSIVMALPFAWLLSTSLKADSQVWLFPPKWIPEPIKWRNYWDALTLFPFHIYFRNTAVITLLAITGTLLSSSFCAYGFARLRFPGRDIIFIVVLSTMMLPPIVELIPQFIMFKYLGWVDTFLPLIVPTFFGGSAFNIFLLRQFFRQIPTELTHAARIDGCSEIGIYLRIIMPLSKPALTAVVIFSFLFNWNDFLRPLIYINSPRKFTVALGLASFMDVYTTNWNFLMAAAAVSIFPVLVMFFSAQRYFIQGVILSGLKG